MAENEASAPSAPSAEDTSAAVHRDTVTYRTRLDVAVDAVGRALSWAFLIAVGISIFEVIARYAFNRPTLWAHESTIAIVAICFAFGGAYTLARDKHIRISLVYGAVPPRVRHVLDIVNDLLTFIFALGLAYAAWDLFERSIFAPTGEWRLERTGSAWNPPLPPLVKGLLMLSLCLIAVQSLLHLIRSLTGRPPHKTVSR